MLVYSFSLSVFSLTFTLFSHICMWSLSMCSLYSFSCTPYVHSTWVLNLYAHFARLSRNILVILMHLFLAYFTQLIYISRRYESTNGMKSVWFVLIPVPVNSSQNTHSSHSAHQNHLLHKLGRETQRATSETGFMFFYKHGDTVAHNLGQTDDGGIL